MQTFQQRAFKGTLLKGLRGCPLSFNKPLEPLAIVNVIVQHSLINVKHQVPNNWITGNYFL